MPLKYHLSQNALQIAVWKIEESEEELWKKVMLSPDQEQYLRTISHSRRRLESLAARAALATLKKANSSFHSLSHSFPWAAAAIAPFPLAIDLEKYRPFPPQVQDYFTQNIEQQAFMSKNKTFWHAWCAKEVAYKLLCSEFSGLSFKRELFFDGERVIFSRGEIVRPIALQFIEEADWLLAVGTFA